MTLKRRIFLVSCVSKKLAAASAAKDLYCSTWFRLARAYVESFEAPWFILSAKHGLIHPDKVIEPYNESLVGQRIAARREWTGLVQAQMEAQLPAADEIVLLAGERYREFIEPYLRQQFRAVDVPMKGLRIGKQLQWLKHG